MSQFSSMAGDGLSQVNATKTPTGRAVLLLAVAVVLGIGLLHELDSSPAASNGELATTQAAQSQQNTAAAENTTTTVAARVAADIKVLVANGTAVNGAAAKVASRLQPIGYQLLKPGNTTKNDYAASGIQYAEGFQTEAQAVATAIGIPAAAVQPLATPAPLTDLQGANVLIIVGSDLASGTATQQSATGTGTQQNTSANAANNALNGPLTRNTTTTLAVSSGSDNGTNSNSGNATSGN